MYPTLRLKARVQGNGSSCHRFSPGKKEDLLFSSKLTNERVQERGFFLNSLHLLFFAFLFFSLSQSAYVGEVRGTSLMASSSVPLIHIYRTLCKPRAIPFSVLGCKCVLTRMNFTCLVSGSSKSTYAAFATRRFPRGRSKQRQGVRP